MDEGDEATSYCWYKSYTLLLLQDEVNDHLGNVDHLGLTRPRCTAVDTQGPTDNGTKTGAGDLENGNIPIEFENEEKEETMKELFLCTDCDKQYFSKNALKRHSMVHSGKYHSWCTECSAGFVSRYHLEDHLRQMHGSLKLVCFLCNKKMASRQGMQRHVKAHHGDRVQCDICKKSYPEGRIKEHKVRAHSKLNHCTECSLSFGTPSCMKSHMVVHGSRNFKCAECTFCTKHKYSLNRHMQRHKPVDKHLCTKCGKSFRRKDYLVCHEKDCKGYIQELWGVDTIKLE
ncbi:gastrula zinc finger protein XlCGF8.2DB [Lingula anatina]|uniref:Gastrula zinc finger protein XlCGF8.2DB n=1 Tax=Lingula anatina TaxID=7574 RepID=A0A1S3INX4_LINAN|nr:gastrula zinc finger protein XlCGF8.2DB [Lingula anatina]|eukprot:XP_013399596.1 gastrula zinc finger protein XlCGF8.2DB [Lingula anatina]